MSLPSFPLTVTEPGRADAVLAAALDGLTRSAAQRWLEEGRVTQNGSPLKKNAKLQPGDQLLVSPPQPEPIDLVPQDIPLDVVYEDGDVIVVNKPVGMVVHPAPGHPDGTLVNALLYHCGDSLSGINGELRPGIVHRSDRDTSGLLIAWPWAPSERTPAPSAPPSGGTERTESGWPSPPAGGRPSPTGRWWTPPMVIPTSPAAWRQAEPTKSGCTWPISATPCWGTRYTAGKNPCPAWRASASTPPGSRLPTRPPGSA